MNNIFNIKIHKLRRERAFNNWEKFSYLKKISAERVYERLFEVNRCFELGLDLGCHYGELGLLLKNKNKIKVFTLPNVRCWPQPLVCHTRPTHFDQQSPETFELFKMVFKLFIVFSNVLIWINWVFFSKRIWPKKNQKNKRCKYRS